ncbi:2-hydroxyethylphosphonate methyltransferase [BD1-7 clade bacterium]|uniref:2-hydroxyethylphosphonate methyltransferase n=1 Tax=BD1-7 clade bacterium TaxID=2029982 RepID=A0A5S9PF98_9GAMM|nr:2-hydroxyethylphosphonate methyltransferase [BD1-7 clade bacterium]
MNKKKVILYNPESDYFTMPLALVALASNVDRRLFDVEIVDARLMPDAHEYVLSQLNRCICVAMSVLTGKPIKDALTLSRKVKRSNNDVPVVWGGWHTSLFGPETLLEPSIDISVQGQGEITFAELLRRLELGMSLDGLLGICWRNQDQIVENDKRELTPLDELGNPDFAAIDVERYFQLKGKRQFDYISSIGCPFRCAFCADPYVYQRKWQGESSQRVADNIERLWHKYQFDDVNFQDETFFVYAKRVIELAQAFIDKRLPFSWAATLRADQGSRLPDDAWRLCKESGMRRVLIGVESGSADMVKRISKDTTLDQVLYCAEQCVKYDLEVIFSIIVGFPGESDEQIRQTLAFAKKLNQMSEKFRTPVFYFKPYPGSELAFDMNADMPSTLDRWAEFDYVDGPQNAWIDEQLQSEIELFKNEYAAY